MNAIKLPFKFDVSKMVEEVKNLNETDYYEIYNPFLEPDTLFGFHLIEPELIDGEPVFEPNVHLKNSPYLLSIYNTFKCHKETFRVHSLKAGASIKRHRDIARNYENNVIRIHVPIISNNEVYTYLNDERVEMKPGECWYMDLDLYHEISNRSKQDRVNLVMDCVRNEWWDEVFKSTGKGHDSNPYRNMSKEELGLMLDSIRTLGNKQLIEDQIRKEMNSRAN